MVKLIRVCYGKADVPEEDREYHLENDRRVGTLSEFKKIFGDQNFEIIDQFEGSKEE